jgi:EAL domain-containing protein (putative c-di-GMP-specific phosphodiesterase class I)/GGDEF domain-containing protein
MEHPEDPLSIEAQRCQRIEELCLLDHERDEAFDQIIAICVAYFRVPIVLISIVDQHRQWFIAKAGLRADHTPRAESFCAYTLHTHEFLEVPDATLDPRFRDNPLVTGMPNIRYYAGEPLTTHDGLGLGTLCLIDTVPRPPMSAKDRSMLNQLTGLVMTRIMALRSRNYVDATTGLHNRLRFEEDIVAARQDAPDHLIAAIDILSPGFFNDVVKTLGYDFSSSLMVAIMDRLLALMPGTCRLYKIGPTRFGLLLPPDTCEALCQAIVNDFKAPVVCQDIPLLMTVGIGLLGVEQAGLSSRQSLRLAISAADDARGKLPGWGHYERTLDTQQQRTFTLLRSLITAMQSNDQLRLVYQPRIHMTTGECTSVEALLRWEHPTLGAVSPAEFIPLAEKTALMGQLSLWVLRTAITQAALWQRAGLRFKVSINATVNDLETPHFTDALIALTKQADVDPHLLEVEVTESARIIAFDTVVKHLDRLCDNGVEIAIDDFGTGYSNWSHLQQLPARVVKLDQSLIDNLAHSEKTQCLVRTLIQLGTSLGYRVVAEGVETQESFQLVKTWGCHEVQGFLIARPMDPVAVTEWLSRRTAKRA